MASSNWLIFTLCIKTYIRLSKVDCPLLHVFATTYSLSVMLLWKSCTKFYWIWSHLLLLCIWWDVQQFLVQWSKAHVKKTKTTQTGHWRIYIISLHYESNFWFKATPNEIVVTIAHPQHVWASGLNLIISPIIYVKFDVRPVFRPADYAKHCRYIAASIKFIIEGVWLEST